MREIVVISGKGGTGKTSLTASFAVLAGEEAIIADCDVDAADMHLLLDPDFEKPNEFYSGTVARIDPELCIACGRCAEACRFDAIRGNGAAFRVDEIDCEGCGYCARVCPVEAIENLEQVVGHWYDSAIRTGSRMLHARLRIGAENSGKLVAKVKNEAKRRAGEQGKELVLVDGSPGIGCPVVSSLSGASYVLLVTESSASGLHDLKRVHELVARFGIACGCVINKADLNPAVSALIRAFLIEKEVDLVAEIPYSDSFTRAMTGKQTIVEYDPEIGRIISDCWRTISKDHTAK